MFIILTEKTVMESQLLKHIVIFFPNLVDSYETQRSSNESNFSS